MPEWSWLPGEVRGDGGGDEGLHGLPVDLLEHEQDLRALRDQLTLAAGVKLFYSNKTQKKNTSEAETPISLGWIKKTTASSEISHK